MTTYDDGNVLFVTTDLPEPTAIALLALPLAAATRRRRRIACPGH
jgi:hypothetical protein